MATYMRHVFSIQSLGRTLLFKQGLGIHVQPKRCVRALKRTPVKVLYPKDEVAKRPQPPSAKVKSSAGNSSSRAQTISDPVRSSSSREPQIPKQEPQIPKQEPPIPKQEPLAGRKFEVDGLRFEKSFPGDKRLSRLVSVARSRTFREHQGKILLEGKRLICDALEAGAKPQMVFFSQIERLRELPLDKLRAATLVKVKFEEIKIWSDVVAPQGVIAIFSHPDQSQLNFADVKQSVPLSLICDNIRDPGNLGTMLRCAAAAGCHSVLLTKGCVDAWEPKVLRSAMGAHFRLPVFPNLSWTEVEKYLLKQTTVHVAENHREIEQVAASHKSIKKTPEDFDSSSDDDDYEDDDDDTTCLDSKLYHDTWARGPTAVVIGGETTGLSPEALALAKNSAGKRLFIPMVHSVESLNSAMAASIVLFEGRKQLLKLTKNPKTKLK